MSVRKKPYHKFPWHPVELTKSEARGLQAVFAGVASDVQQKKALETIVNKICAVNDLEFRPDEMGGERASAFAGGKRFAGEQIRKWLFATGAEIEALPD